MFLTEATDGESERATGRTASLVDRARPEGGGISKGERSRSSNVRRHLVSLLQTSDKNPSLLLDANGNRSLYLNVNLFETVIVF